MNDKTLLKLIDLSCIFMITFGTYLLFSVPNDLELIKIATPEEIAGWVLGFVTLLFGGLVYVFSEKMFMKEVKK